MKRYDLLEQGDCALTEHEEGAYYLASDVEQNLGASLQLLECVKQRDARIAELERLLDVERRAVAASYTSAAIAVKWEANAKAKGKRVDELEKTLREAIESVEDWAGYASEYFQEKHDLAGELKRLKSVL